MKTTIEWIDEAKTRLGLTDYALSKRLGISTSVMSNYRTGRHVLSENHAILLGQVMGIDPLPIVAAAAFERSKADHIRSFWAKHAETLGAVAMGTLLAGTLITAPSPARAAGEVANSTGNQLYIMSTRRRGKRTRPDRRERWSRNITGLWPGFFSSLPGRSFA